MPDPLGGFAYTWPFFAGALIAYLIGAIPFGLLLTRLAGLGDVRDIGSGNIGATNVLRTGRKGLAALTLALDGGKGAAAVLVAMNFGSTMAWYAGIAVVIGHMFPVWLKFRGGKGVATTLGVLLGVAWPVGLLSCATWLVVAALFRISSLAGLVSIVGAPVYTYILSDALRGELPLYLAVEPLYVTLAALLAVIVIARHHANIRRLIKGEEPKITLGDG